MFLKQIANFTKKYIFGQDLAPQGAPSRTIGIDFSLCSWWETVRSANTLSPCSFLTSQQNRHRHISAGVMRQQYPGLGGGGKYTPYIPPPLLDPERGWSRTGLAKAKAGYDHRGWSLLGSRQIVDATLSQSGGGSWPPPSANPGGAMEPLRALKGPLRALKGPLRALKGP